MKAIRISTAALIISVCLGLDSSCQAVVSTVLLEDFESGATHGATAVTLANSSTYANSNTVATNVSESGSKRLRLMDADGGANGCVIVFTDTLTTAGNYIVTADVKVNNSSAVIGSFGMAAVAGQPSPVKVSDTNAGYVMNLSGSGDAALGYQTIGAALNVKDGVFPRALTLYFSTNPSGNDYNAPTDGVFRYTHRTTTATWAAGSSNAVYIDNIKLIGSGNFGEDRHYWVSAGNSYNNLARVQFYIDITKNNHFNCVDILARFRTDAYYVPNRDYATYPNPEPYGTLVSGGTPGPKNDPLQYLIDHCHEAGIKAYISFSTFLATPNDTYPSVLPSGSQTWIYNEGSPRPQVSADSSEGIWADVGRADVRQHLINVLCDIVQNYDVDGVIFDRIRYEHSDYGYNPAALAEMGISGTPLPSDANFIAKRRQAVTTFLHDAYEAATNIKPWVVVGTVPIIYGTSFYSTYSDVMQFWPAWSAVPTRNRVISFGAEDCIQPQAYRSGSAYGPYNTVYLDLGRYGDRASYALDYGLMPGANVNFSPLFYHPSSGDSAQSLLNAQNVCDARNKECNGNGIYSADTVRSDIHLIRTSNSGSCGMDVYASPAPNADFLMKSGYDNTPPNPVTNLILAAAGSRRVNLSWTIPAPAADGETATRFLIYRGVVAGVKQYYATLCNKTQIVSNGSYTDTTPDTGNYYYRVVPADRYNNYGAAAEAGPVGVTGVAASTVPTVPDNIRVMAAGNVAYITWNDNSTNEKTFELQRNGTKIATLPENVAAWTDNNVAAGSQTYRVRAVNSAGGSAYATASAVTTANSLAAPSGLAASDAGGMASLSWTDNSADESGFEILRATVSGGPYVQALTVSPGATSCVDRVAPGDYYYVARSFNGAAISFYSNQARVTVTPPLPPNPPSELTAVTTRSSIMLNWKDNSTNEAGFEVFRGSVPGGPYNSLAVTLPNATSFKDDLTSPGAYYYVVCAFNAAGKSSFTNEADASVASPSAPSNLKASVSASNVILTWNDNSGNESGFRIYHSTGGAFSVIASAAPEAVTYTHYGASAGDHYYKVSAFNGVGESGFSNQVMATVAPITEIIIESRDSSGARTPSPTYAEYLASGGAWSNTVAKSGAPGLTGLGGRFTGSNSLGSYAVFTPTIITAGYYDVYITLPNATSGPNINSPGAGFLIVHDGTDIAGTVDLVPSTPDITDRWYLLAHDVRFAAGTSGYLRITNNNTNSADTQGRFNMDAVKFTLSNAGIDTWPLE